ncbi:ECF transporter S component [Atopococcus tabaci]|uniref:ECF transporter S component n=1 Tax=Atopococcus tabaci TaxID=269774 RepID=UPI00240994DD|nr:ECF transporter S component [Atopococcus tabaci]
MNNKGNRRSMWSLNLSTAAIALIPAAIGINYLGKLFAGLLRLPLWLDSIGTVLASILAGPVIGALAGIINNVIFGLTADPISTVYAVTSGAIGLVTGIMAYKGWVSSIKTAAITGLVVGLVAAVVSTPLNILFWGGQTGNVWGDAFFAYLINNNVPLWLASFGNSIIVDVPDKIATVLISYFIFKALPNNFKNIFRGGHKIEEL